MMIDWKGPVKAEEPRFSHQDGDTPFGPIRIVFKANTPKWGVEVTVTPWQERQYFEGGTLKQAREWCEQNLLHRIRECVDLPPVGAVQSILHIDWREEQTHGVVFVDKKYPPGTPVWTVPQVPDSIECDTYHEALQRIIHVVWGLPGSGTGEQAAHEMWAIANEALNKEFERRPFKLDERSKWVQAMVEEIAKSGPGRIEVKPDDRLMAVVDHACGHLPEGISVTLTMENGAGTFDAHDKDGNHIDLPEFTDSALPEELAGIVKYLMHWDQADSQQRKEERSIPDMLEDAVQELSEYKHAQVEEIALNMLAACYRENMHEARQRIAQGQEVEFLEFIEHATDDAFMLAQKFVEQSETIMREGESKAWALVEKAQGLSNGE